MKGTLTHIDGKWAVTQQDQHNPILIQPSMVKYYFLDSEDVGREVEFELSSFVDPISGFDKEQYAHLIPYKHE